MVDCPTPIRDASSELDIPRASLIALIQPSCGGGSSAASRSRSRRASKYLRVRALLLLIWAIYRLQPINIRGNLSPGADNFPNSKIRHRIGSESSVADVGPFPPMLAGRDSRASAEGWTDHRDDVRPSEAHRFANDGAGRRLDQDEERIAHDPIPGPSVVAHDHRDTANPECCLTDLAWGHGPGPLGDNYCRNRCRQLATVVAEASPELVATVAVDVEKCQQQRLGVLPDDDPDRVTRRGSPCEIRSRRGLGSSGARGDRSEPGHERRVRNGSPGCRSEWDPDAVASPSIPAPMLRLRSLRLRCHCHTTGTTPPPPIHREPRHPQR